MTFRDALGHLGLILSGNLVEKGWALVRFCRSQKLKILFFGKRLFKKKKGRGRGCIWPAMPKIFTVWPFTEEF